MLSCYTDERYPGQGLSRGIPRGLMVALNGRSLIGEGMGIGAVVLRDGKGTYVPSSAETLRRAAGRAVTRTVVNRRLVKTLRGRPSGLLTILCERVTDLYMRYPWAQRAFLSFRSAVAGQALQNFTVPCSLSAQTVSEYLWDDRSVRVKCTVGLPAGWRGKVCVLNELAADVLDAAAVDGSPVRTPSGWVALPLRVPTPALVSPTFSLGASITEIDVAPDVPVRLFWGREMGQGLNWAGFCIEVQRTGRGSGTVDLAYRLSLSL